MSVTATLLGTGHSTGVPAAGGFWGKCDPQNPKNRRNRVSAMIKSDTTTIIIDTGPDFRAQSEKFAITDIHAVLYTHAHSDHINGIDDLKYYRFRTQELVNIYGNEATILEIKQRFSYNFGAEHEHFSYPPVLREHVISQEQYDREMTIGDITFVPFEMDHRTTKSMGYRFGDFAYCTDVALMDDRNFKILRGVKNMVIDCGQYAMEPNLHADFNRVLQWNAEIKAPHVYLTHLSIAHDYQTLMNETPDGYQPAYDGLQFDVKL